MISEHYGSKYREDREHFQLLKKIRLALSRFWDTVYTDSWLERKIANCADYNIGC